MRRVDYYSLTTYLFGAQLRSDFNRYYLGTIWWFLEPCLYVAVFYFVFHHFRARSEDFLYQLMCGLVAWKWIATVINQGSASIVQAKGVISSFNIHPVVFPLVGLLVNTFKFLVVLIALLALLQYKGAVEFAGMIPLLFWFITTLLVVFSYQLILSTIMPFLPDLRIIITNMMMLLMFTSGVIVPLQDLSPKAQELLQFNPFVHLIDGMRAVLLRGEMPDDRVFGILLATHLVVLVIGLNRITRLKGEFPKRII